MKRIKAIKFAADTHSGFLPAFDDAMAPNTLRFLWRSAVTTTSFDELGNRTNQTIKSVEQLLVTLYVANDLVWLRVTDPPRSMRELFNALERVGGFGMAIDPHVFSAKQQVQMLRRCTDFRLIGLRGVGSSTEHRFVARIELASKEGIQPKRLPFLEQLRFTADHSSYEIVEQGLQGQVTFTATGVVRVAGPILPFILSQLEAELGIGR
ncbi:hypothetical protein CJO82_00030 [Ralstonia solanacearum]|nr:hypothetical protein CJO82_00030 [Ralstonia solanacearum]AXW22123.1 hypothetical protein CJO86_00030 [Ralstonia solanacearum]